MQTIIKSNILYGKLHGKKNTHAESLIIPTVFFAT